LEPVFITFLLVLHWETLAKEMGQQKYDGY
jgi:hypothetical protein